MVERGERYEPVFVRPRDAQRRRSYTTATTEEGRTMATTKLDADQPRADGKLVGRVTALQREKSFGFIAHATTGEDYFFHKSECPDIWEDLQKYDAVAFIPTEGPKGRRALQVEKA